MATAPSHINWLKQTGLVLKTADGKSVEVLEFNHSDDQDILSNWATHFRSHYCDDADLSDLVEGTGKSKADFLRTIKFPDAKEKPGPSTRAGDFAEILVADYIEYVLGYWCPREVRYEDRFNRNVSTNGCDILAFKLIGNGNPSPQDELFTLETKSAFTLSKNNRLQDAINGSIKDELREAMSLSAIKQRLRKKDIALALQVQRFQNAADHPFKKKSGAAVVVDDELYAGLNATTADASGHPNATNLMIIAIKGPSLMAVAHALYERAANEA